MTPIFVCIGLALTAMSTIDVARRYIARRRLLARLTAACAYRPEWAYVPTGTAPTFPSGETAGRCRVCGCRSETRYGGKCPDCWGGVDERRRDRTIRRYHDR